MKTNKTKAVNAKTKTIKTTTTVVQRKKKQKAKVNPYIFFAGANGKTKHATQVNLEISAGIGLRTNSSGYLENYFYIGEQENLEFNTTNYVSLGLMTTFVGQFMEMLQELKEYSGLYREYRITMATFTFIPVKASTQFIAQQMPFYIKLGYEQEFDTQNLVRIKPCYINYGQHKTLTLVYPKVGTQTNPSDEQYSNWHPMEGIRLVGDFQEVYDHTVISCYMGQPKSMLPLTPSQLIPLWTLQCNFTVALRGEGKLPQAQPSNAVRLVAEPSPVLQQPVVSLEPHDNTNSEHIDDENVKKTSGGENLKMRAKPTSRTIQRLNKKWAQIFTPENAFSDTE